MIWSSLRSLHLSMPWNRTYWFGIMTFITIKKMSIDFQSKHKIWKNVVNLNILIMLNKNRREKNSKCIHNCEYWEHHTLSCDGHTDAVTALNFLLFHSNSTSYRKVKFKRKKQVLDPVNDSPSLAAAFSVTWNNNLRWDNVDKLYRLGKTNHYHIFTIASTRRCLIRTYFIAYAVNFICNCKEKWRKPKLTLKHCQKRYVTMHHFDGVHLLRSHVLRINFVCVLPLHSVVMKMLEKKNTIVPPMKLNHWSASTYRKCLNHLNIQHFVSNDTIFSIVELTCEYQTFVGR